MKNTSSLASNQRTISPPPLFCAIAGPTASGKTDLALALAEKMGCSILCVDAVQVYRGLNVGSAKPTGRERGRIVHYGLDLASPLEHFSASRFAQYAEPILKRCFHDRKPLILCGGTGLYYRALLEGLFEAPDPDPLLRARLNRRAVSEGSAILYAELTRLDPETALSIHPHDTRRITRALEIMAQTGSSVAELRRRQQQKPWMHHTRFIGIDWPRERLHERIAQRTLWMYQNGLIDETRSMILRGCSPQHTALLALGYKECHEYLHGRIGLSDAIERTVIETRRYARRQYTWFNRQTPTNWIKINNFTDLRQMVDESLQLWQKSDNNILLRT